MLIDDKFSTVLDLYHEKMAEERLRNEERRKLTQANPELRSKLRPGRDPEEDDKKFMAIGPKSGQLVNWLIRSQKAPNVLEIGTSLGYSTLWLADAAQAAGGRVTTIETREAKSAYARKMIEEAGLAGHVEFLVGNAVELIGEIPAGFDFVLIDLPKQFYVACLEAIYPKLNPGAIIVADNIIHGPKGEFTGDYVRTIRAKPDITSTVVPVGSGLEISRYKAD